ncbi:CRISPR-associated endoribonuclease Cas6 [Clostridium perfringens]|uniref:CRISPR-associated endoribonuclease Cas6 n=1 Tax=Clostridium perfringens TaxID=1502 RepID=UPI0024BC02A7|nr:CRISPR-associated endoribonuclease Cas6 [Clostridium perfringens]
MRIRIDANIISKTDENIDLHYNHAIYSAILNILPDDISTKIHDENNKTIKYFTFSSVFIKDDNCHFYISGEDDFIMHIIEGLQSNSMLRIKDLILDVYRISELPGLNKKRNYLFKGNIIACEIVNNKKVLIEDDERIEERLQSICEKKLRNRGLEIKPIKFTVISKKRNFLKYKKGVLVGYYSMVFLVTGDYETIQYFYEIGFGENTATGNGIVWEA